MDKQEVDNRLVNEINELQSKIDKLDDFILYNGFAHVSEEQQNLLIEQKYNMRAYARTLYKRLALLRAGE